MAKNLLNRYIWLIDTIRRYGRISRKELNECWARSPYSNGEFEIPRRTFFNYRQNIEQLFSITIECDKSTYEYYLVDHQQGRMSDWLLDSFATSNVLQGSREVASRILLEDVPSAREFLAPIIEALKLNSVIKFDYHSHIREQPTRGVVLEPYFLRIYRQLWYVTGRNTGDGKVKTYSLDRMSNLLNMPETFTPPPDIDPVEYFRDSFGMMVTDDEPCTVKLRVDLRQAKYLHALPLHPSQEEMVSDRYSIFTYRLRITSDFVSEILSYGSRITVISPPELREMVTSQLRAALNNYVQG